MRYLSARFPLAALLIIALLSGVTATPLWSQSSGSSSSSSSSDLRTWEELSGRFNQTLDGQSMRLSLALKETQTARANSQLLTSLLEASSKANEDLKNYNQQIGERMQENDEEKYALYREIDDLEKRILAQDSRVLRLVLVCVCLSAVIVAFIGVAVAKGYVRLPLKV